MLAQDPQVGQVLRIVAVCAFIAVCIRLFRDGVSLTPVVGWLLVAEIQLFISTWLYSGDMQSCIFTALSHLGVAFLVVHATRDQGRATNQFMSILAWVLLIYLACNAWTIFFATGSQIEWSNGFTQTSYFLGIRTRVTDVIFPAILFCAVSDLADKGKVGKRTVAAVMLGLVQAYYLSVSTAFVGFAVLISVSAFYVLVVASRPLLSLRNIVISSTLLSAFFVIGRGAKNGVVEGIAAQILEKSLTFTGRTEIWVNALPYVTQSPWIGHGVNGNLGAFVPWQSGRLWQAHNQYLQLAYDSGLIGVAIYVAFSYAAASALDRSVAPVPVKAVFAGVFAAFAVMSVSEIFTYNMGVMYVLLLGTAGCANLSYSKPSKIYKGRSSK
jgi:hypothetical protein